jgi:hypothetical protein
MPPSEAKSSGARRRTFFIGRRKGSEAEDGGSRKEFGHKRALVDMSGALRLEVRGDEGLTKEKDNEDRERG